MIWDKKIKPFKLYEYYPLCVVDDIFVDISIINSMEATIRIVQDKKLSCLGWNGLSFKPKKGTSVEDKLETYTMVVALLVTNITVDSFLNLYAHGGCIIYIENMHLLSLLAEYRKYRNGVKDAPNSETCGKVWAYYREDWKESSAEKKRRQRSNRGKK